MVLTNPSICILPLRILLQVWSPPDLTYSGYVENASAFAPLPPLDFMANAAPF